jgi:hypothetical protein
MVQTPSVRLAGAPAAFLPDHWARFRQNYIDDQRAVDDLSNNAIQWIGYYAGEAVRQQRDVDGRGAETVARAQLAADIVAAMLRMLRDGVLVATGIQPPNLERVEVPQELWASLKLGFADDSAQDNNFSIAHVRVSRAPLDSSARVRVCVDWLRNQADRTKKVLKPAALDEIPSLTTREFDAAYAVVFSSPVGRPRKHVEN